MHQIRRKHSQLLRRGSVGGVEQRLRTVEVTRGRSGYGFTLSGQYPCCLNSIASGGSAERAGLKSGDKLVRINGIVVSHAAHDEVVRLIGSSAGILSLEVVSEISDSVHNQNKPDLSSEDDLVGSSRFKNRERGKVLTPVRTRRNVPVPVATDFRNLPSKANSGKYASQGHLSKDLFSARILEPINDVSNFVPERRCNRNAGTDEDINIRVDRKACGKGDGSHGVVTRRSIKGRYPSPVRPIKHTIITHEVRLGLQKPVVTTEYGPGYRSRDYDVDIDDDDAFCSGDSDFRPVEVQIIVGYVGTVKTSRDPKITNSRLQSIRAAVQRLRASQNSHTVVMMEANAEGIRLVDCRGRPTALFLTSRVAFCGVCPDDHRFFAIVTFQSVTVPTMTKILAGAPSVDDEIAGCNNFCHVFMVNPDISMHRAHRDIADQFAVNCTLDVDRNECTEFPSSSTVVIAAIGRLYRKRQDSSVIVQLAHSSYDELSDQRGVRGGIGSGSENAMARQSNRAYVVETAPIRRDMGDGAEQDSARSGSSRSDDSLGSVAIDNSLIHNLSEIKPAVSSFSRSVSLDRSLIINTAASTSVPHSSHNAGEDADADFSMSFRIGSHPTGKLDPHGTMTKNQSFVGESVATPDRLEVRQASDSYRPVEPSYNKTDGGLFSNMRRLKTPPTIPEEDSVEPSGYSATNVGSRESSSRCQETPDVQSNVTPVLPPRNNDVARNSSTKNIVIKNNRLPPVIPSKVGGLLRRPSGPVQSAALTRKPTPGPMRAFQIQPEHLVAKPPLPDANPVMPRLVYRSPVVGPVASPGKKVIVGQERSKSTPPVLSELCLSITVDKARYNSVSDDDDGSGDRQCDVVAAIVDEEDKEPLPCVDGGGSDHCDDIARRLSEGQTNKVPAHAVIMATTGTFHKTGNKTGNIQSAMSCKGLSNITRLQDIGRAASWALQFDRLLADEAGLATFTEFLKKEYSQENIIFWNKCEEYKRLPAEQRQVRATEMFNAHLVPFASDPINVDEETRLAVERELSNASTNTFDPAQKHIYMLMKQDSYTRFLKSDIYKQAVISEMEGRPFQFGRTPENDHSKKSSKRNDKSSMKKSKSSGTTNDVTDEKRRRSILPWNRNKIDKKLLKSVTNPDSSKKGTSLTSLLSKENIAPVINNSNVDNGRGTIKKSCRVILSDGSFTTIHVYQGQSVHDALGRLGEKLKLELIFTEVVLSDTGKIVDARQDIQTISSREIRLEKRVVFRLDLPSPNLPIAVRARPERKLREVLRPILRRYGCDIEGVSVFVGGTQMRISYDSLVSSLDCVHLRVINNHDEKSNSAAGVTSSDLPPQWSDSGGGVFRPAASVDVLDKLFQDVVVSDKDCVQPWLAPVYFDELGVCRPDIMNPKVKSPPVEGHGRGLLSFIRRNSLGEKDRRKESPRYSAGPVMPPLRPFIPPSPSTPDNVGLKKESKFFDLLTRAQSRQFDDQRGMTMFGVQIPAFLRRGDGNYNENHGREEDIQEEESDWLDAKIFLESDRHPSEDVSETDPEITKKRNTFGGFGSCVINEDESVKNGALSSYDNNIDCPTPTHSQMSYVDESFSSGVLPSHDDAEVYFSRQIAGGRASPDFNDSRLMEKSLRDLGIGREEGLGGVSNGKTSECLSGTRVTNNEDDDDHNVFVIPSVPWRRVATMPYERSKSSLSSRSSKFGDFSPSRISVDANSTPAKGNGFSDASSSGRKSVSFRDAVLESWVRSKLMGGSSNSMERSSSIGDNDAKNSVHCSASDSVHFEGRGSDRDNDTDNSVHFEGKGSVHRNDTESVYFEGQGSVCDATENVHFYDRLANQECSLNSMTSADFSSVMSAGSNSLTSVGSTTQESMLIDDYGDAASFVIPSYVTTRTALIVSRDDKLILDGPERVSDAQSYFV